MPVSVRKEHKIYYNINCLIIVSQRGKLDIDLIIFFKYLVGLKEEKSVKSLGFKMQKHPSTIRRMIKKVEEYMDQDILIYENYEVKITLFGELLLTQYEVLGHNINLEHLINTEKNLKKNISNRKNIAITSDFLLPYVHRYIRIEKLMLKNLYILKKNQCYEQCDMVFHHFQPSCNPNIGELTSTRLPLYLMRNSQYKVENSLVIHGEIKKLVDKLIDLTIFHNITIVDNVFSLTKILNESGCYSICYEEFLDTYNTSLFIKKPLYLSLNVFFNN